MTETAACKRPLSAGQKRLLAQMPELADSAFPKVLGSVPAISYTDPERFEAEKDGVFRSVPVIAGPSGILAEPRTRFQLDVVGTPVLLTRTGEGVVKAFANVCRHRGAKLCSETESVKGSRVSCPYHAWTYDLTGKLVGVPRQEIFPGLDKSQLGLIPLPCVEAGGLIWVHLDPHAAPDFSSVQGELGEDLDALGLGSMHIYRRATFEVKANWKLVMDSMLDSYHVTRLHKDSVGKFFVDNENVIDLIGPHIRNASARGNFEKRLVSDDFEEVRRIMVFSYTPFPNGIIVVSPDFVSLGVVRPEATDRTCVDYYMLINGPTTNEKFLDKLRRSFELMEITFAKEDYWAAELCDQGLRSGAIRDVQVGGMEIQITMFHDAVNRCLERRSSG